MSSLPSTWIKVEKTIKTIEIDYVEIKIEEVLLNQGVKCFIIYFDQDQNVVERKSIFIEGEDYERWIEDDDLIDVVLEKFHLQRIF